MAYYVMVRPVSVPTLNGMNNHNNSNNHIASETIEYQDVAQPYDDFVPSQSIDNQDAQPTLKGIANMLRQTRQCKHYLRGSCKYGDKCGFSHSDSVKERPNLAKTKMCSKFQKGSCDRGGMCPFAHCREELRHVNVPTKAAGAKNALASISAETHFEHVQASLPPKAQTYPFKPACKPPRNNVDGPFMMQQLGNQDCNTMRQARPFRSQDKKIIAASAFPVTSCRFVEDRMNIDQNKQSCNEDECVTPKMYASQEQEQESWSRSSTPRVCPSQAQEQGSWSRSSTPPPEHTIFGYGMHPDLLVNSEDLKAYSY
jgi:hypothetical protein